MPLMQGARVPSLVWELQSHMPRGTAKKQNKQTRKGEQFCKAIKRSEFPRGTSPSKEGRKTSTPSLLAKSRQQRWSPQKWVRKISYNCKESLTAQCGLLCQFAKQEPQTQLASALTRKFSSTGLHQTLRSTSTWLMLAEGDQLLLQAGTKTPLLPRHSSQAKQKP